jgi:hypothetical protein
MTGFDFKYSDLHFQGVHILKKHIKIITHFNDFHLIYTNNYVF